MDFKGTLKECQQKVDKEITAFMEKQVEAAKGISPECEEMAKLLKEYAERGGKRIRPVLVVFGYKACGGEDEREILKAAVPIELIHAYLLIHDDIMDEADTRRGLPSFHKQYEEIYSKRFKGKETLQTAINAGVIGGDIIEAYAGDALIEANFDAEKKVAFLKRLNSINAHTGYGQLLDTMLEIKDAATEEDVEMVHLLKTAKYSMEGPLHLGAILAGASEKQMQELSDYAIPVGKAFQMQDDILGMFGSEEKLGKPIDSDLKEGKKTHIILKALEKADAGQKEKILKALGNTGISNEEFEEVRKIIQETGALDYAKEKAKSLAQQGLKTLEKSSLSPEGKEFLKGMAIYIYEREF